MMVLVLDEAPEEAAVTALEAQRGGLEADWPVPQAGRDRNRE